MWILWTCALLIYNYAIPNTITVVLLEEEEFQQTVNRLTIGDPFDSKVQQDGEELGM